MTAKKNSGLTLIEVLIALAIISIALTAIIKATTQSIRANTYLQNKTIALWIAEEVMSEARLKLLTLPEAPDQLKQNTTVLGRPWHWQASEEITSNPRINKITVNVFADRDEKEGETPLIDLESYVYRDDKSSFNI